jgi:hypothetical protein
MLVLLQMVFAVQVTQPIPQVTMGVYYAKDRIGTAVFTYSVQHNNILSKKIEVEILSNNSSNKIKEEAQYQADGTPISKKITSYENGKTKIIEATFKQTVASYAVYENNKLIQSKTKETKAGAQIRAEPEWWFIRDRPSRGTAYTYQRFDMNFAEWRTETAKYLGVREISLSNRKVSSHFIQSQEMEIDLDQKGMPLRMKAKQVTFERE